MPGTILDIKVAVGQAVKEGELVCILEAMKMENEIYAPCAGTVAQVLTSKGAKVDTGIYLYRCRVRCGNSNWTSKTQKIMVRNNK